MVHLLFGPEVRFMLQENDAEDMKTFLETLHPATVAEALTGDLEADQVWRFLQHTSITNQAAIFEYFPIEQQVQMVEGTGREHMAHLIEKMSHDDRVELLRRLQPRVAESLLRLVDEADRKDIATLARQSPNTAGGLMTTDYAWLPPSLTATEALDRLRLQAPESETIYYIFVLDDDRRLIGVLSLRELILAGRHALIRDLMETQFVSVRVGDDREIVATELARYDLIAIPVVDDNNRMVGIVTHDDIIDVVVEEATEDAYRMGAVGLLAENYLDMSFVTVWRKRAFWLACLFVAEFFTFTAMAHYEEQISKLVVLSLFIPLCLSTGGNSGSQAATLITRAMALGQVQLRDWFNVIRHELLMGLALGATLGAIGFLRAFATPDAVRGASVDRLGLAYVICLAVTCICLWGTIVGSMLPLGFKRMGVDPGIASSPFVATFVDVTGIMIYFTIASSILLVGAGNDSDEAAAEWRNLGGVWKVTAKETNGDVSHAEDWGMHFVFANEKLIIIDPPAMLPGKSAESAEFSITLMPNSNPRAFEAITTNGKKERKVFGIYKFEGTELHICLTDGDSTVGPTAFEAPRNSSLTVWTMTRGRK
jgi:magnesium transporter